MKLRHTPSWRPYMGPHGAFMEERPDSDLVIGARRLGALSHPWGAHMTHEQLIAQQYPHGKGGIYQ